MLGLLGLLLASGWQLDRLSSERCRYLTVPDDSAWSIVFAVNSTCPLSRQYIPEIRRITERYRRADRRFYLLQVNDSAADSLFRMPHAASVVDPEGKQAGRFLMSVVPAVMVYRGDPFGCFQSERVWYQGAIDNWAIALGRHRYRITEPYLIRALDAADAGRKADPAYTPAVGCFIETFRL